MYLAHESDHKIESPLPQEISYQPTGKDTGGLDDSTAGAPQAESHDSPRPRTRSQTGSTGKRRLSDEMQPPSPERLVTSRKKQRAASKMSSTSTDVDTTKEGHRTDSPVTDPQDTSQSTTRSPSPLGATPPLTFLESSASPGYAPERRGPRSRATLPVPVPNLTKKSRGRRVPTQEVTEVQSDTKEKRMYVCKVEGCGKCFHRGEHLKRHIRSIHTHEKPFMCTHPACGKFFNRHDNLLQHLKVHRQNSGEEEGNPRPFLKLSPPSPSPSPEPEPSMDHDSDSSASESDSEARAASPAKSTFPITPVSYDPYVPSARFSAPCESFTTNMAVSSLRTELPSHSPPTSRVRDSL